MTDSSLDRAALRLCANMVFIVCEHCNSKVLWGGGVDSPRTVRGHIRSDGALTYTVSSPAFKSVVAPMSTHLQTFLAYHCLRIKEAMMNVLSCVRRYGWKTGGRWFDGFSVAVWARSHSLNAHQPRLQRPGGMC